MVRSPNSRLVFTVCELKGETIQRGRFMGRLMMGLGNGKEDNLESSLKP